jgi:hypothetical protein
VGAERDKAVLLDPPASAQDPLHGGAQVVVADAAGNAAEERAHRLVGAQAVEPLGADEASATSNVASAS